MLYINIHHISGECANGLSSLYEPLGMFSIAIDTQPTTRSWCIVSGVGNLQPSRQDIINICMRKLMHVRINNANGNLSVVCNYAWLCSIATYIQKKYACEVDPEYEKEFWKTQFSGYGHEFSQYHISSSKLALMYSV